MSQMAKAIMGRKMGMTQVFTDDGQAVPVTVIEAGPCVVIQKKTVDRDGYDAVQVGYVNLKQNKVTRPCRGHFSRWGVEPKRFVREFRLANGDGVEPGDEINVDQFSPGELVDVSGINKGKGFTGGIKRWGFSRGPMTHGSKYHRGPGSLQSRDASRVFKGRKLPGRMGGKRVTVQGLEIVRVYPDRNLMLVKGAVPGPKGGLITIKSSVKADRE